MMQIIGCTYCKKESMLAIEFRFLSQVFHCIHCKETKDDEWVYHFCNIDCFTKWFEENEITQKGVPCKDCGSYRLQGECKRCGGSGKVLKTNTNFKTLGGSDEHSN